MTKDGKDKPRQCHNQERKRSFAGKMKKERKGKETPVGLWRRCSRA